MTWLRLARLADNDLPLPQYATEGSAGLDFSACLTRPCLDPVTKAPYLVANRELTIPAGEVVLVPLGFKSQFEAKHVLKLFIRSSLSLRGLVLANSVAIIDSDYRGEIFAPLYNRNMHGAISVKHGDRIVQGLLEELPGALVSETQVGDTGRGTGGFGSTGI